MTKQFKAELAILSITLVWGSSFIIMKNISADIPAYAYLTLRFAVAGLVMFLIFNKHLKNITKKTLWSGILVGFTIYCGMILQVIGLKTTSASNSAFITGLNVVMVPIISATLLKKKPPLNAVIGVVLATFGLFALKGFTGQWRIGDTLTLLCAVCFAFQIIFIDKYAQDVHIYQFATVQMFAAAIFCGLTWILMGTWGNPEPIVFSREVILTVLYTGVLGTAFAYGVQTVAQKYTTPTRTALLLTFEPVFGALFALIVPNAQGVTETLTIQTFLGCLLIFSGMVVTELKFKKLRYRKKA